MNDRRQMRRDEDGDRERSSAPQRERRENPEAASILDLQGSAGNRAVAQLLETRDSRDTRAAPALATLQRQPVDQGSEAEPTDTRTSAVGTLSIPDLEMAIPILSFSHSASGTREPRTASGEVFVSMAVERMDPRLVDWMVKGKPFAVITVAVGSKATFTLRGVQISSINVSGDTASLSLSFESIEFGPGR